MQFHIKCAEKDNPQKSFTLPVTADNSADAIEAMIAFIECDMLRSLSDFLLSIVLLQNAAESRQDVDTASKRDIDEGMDEKSQNRVTARNNGMRRQIAKPKNAMYSYYGERIYTKGFPDGFGYRRDYGGVWTPGEIEKDGDTFYFYQFHDYSGNFVETYSRDGCLQYVLDFLTRQQEEQAKQEEQK